MNTCHYYQNPDHRNQNPHFSHHHFKQMVLGTVEPIAYYGITEAQHTSYIHALREVAAISYLMGMGYDSVTARQIVESWEMNETF